MASWITIFAFIGGIVISAIIDKLFPDHIEPKCFKPESEEAQEIFKKQKLHRMGLFTAGALAIHNFPEGLATFMAGMTDITLGISIAVAIAIHNIPEGVSIALPIYHATGSKLKAFGYSFLAGLAEPLGAILGFTFFGFLFNDLSFGILFALVAGIMVYVAFDELLPMAREYGKGHIEIFGVTLGMFVMAVSLILF
jgi:ZIP family zinc transporter